MSNCQDYIFNSYLVIGCGKSGIATAKFLQTKKQVGNIKLFDSNFDILKKVSNEINIDYFSFTKTDELDIFDCAIVSPGINLCNKPPSIVKALQSKKIPILSDLDVWQKYNEQANSTYIGITGTNGKSTLSSLIYFILKKANISCGLGGNIGIPFAEIKPQNAKYHILELSSYQLLNSICSNINIATITNFDKDHLDYHGNMEAYINAKLRIINKNTILILNKDDQSISDAKQAILRRKEGLNNKNEILWFSTKKILSKGISIIGKTVYYNNTFIGELNLNDDFDNFYNIINIANALMVCSLLLRKENLQKSLKELHLFHSLPHRNQIIGKKNNLIFVNDSKATNISATMLTITTSPDKVILISGGRKKEEGIKKLKTLKNKIKKIFLIGECQEDFYNEIHQEIITEKTDTIEKAINYAIEFAKTLNNKVNYRIILSPAAASFDQFKNFEKRGERFISLIEKELIKN